MTTWHNLKGRNQIKTTFFQHCVCTVGWCGLLGSEKQPWRLSLRSGNLFPWLCLEMVWWELSCWFVVTLRPLRSLVGPPCIDTPKVLAHVPLFVATHNQNMFKAWFYTYGGNISISTFNSLLLPLYDQSWSSSFVSLSSSVMGLHKVLPIKPIWAPISADANTFSLFGEEYGLLLCKT